MDAISGKQGYERASMKKKIVAAALAILMCLGTTGCGENAIPNLDEEELQAIGEYTAVTLMKYDANRRSRLVELPEETTEPTEPSEQVPQETPEPSGMAPVDETPVIDRADDTQESSMEEVLALPQGMRISYLGEEVCDAYPHDGEEHYFMLTATSGKKLLVLSFQLTNETEQEQSVDIASQNVEFRITVNDDYKRRAMPSLLLDDLSTYVDAVPAGETRTAVLVIEVEQQADEEITSLSLKLKNDTKIYTIQLK